MSRYKYKAEEVIRAIEGAEGNLTQAAKNLGCARGTVYKYINDFATVKAAFEDVNERTIDMVEGQLMTQVKRGNMTAIIFYLKTKAKHRGYVERQEIKHDGSLEIEYVNDWRHAKEEN
jgi:hypothetical protein